VAKDGEYKGANVVNRLDQSSDYDTVIRSQPNDKILQQVLDEIRVGNELNAKAYISQTKKVKTTQQELNIKEATATLKKAQRDAEKAQQ